VIIAPISPWFGEIEHRRQQRHAGDLVLVVGAHHRERRRKDRAADAEAERVDLLGAGDVERRVDRRQRSLLQVIVPRAVAELGGDVPPRHQEHRMALLDRMADERVFRRQVEDVELVDARRDDDQRPLAWTSAVVGLYWIAGSGRSRTPPSPASPRRSCRLRTPSRRSSTRGPSAGPEEEVGPFDQALAAGFERELDRLGFSAGSSPGSSRRRIAGREAQLVLDLSSTAPTRPSRQEFGYEVAVLDASKRVARQACPRSAVVGWRRHSAIRIGRHPNAAACASRNR
jgi:hypothetical protein